MSILLSSLLLLSSAQAKEPKDVDCSYDLDAMLALDQQQFDQDQKGGWRTLSSKGCHSEAAELIREWRFHKRSHENILYWHKAQLRAFAGQTQQAIDLFSLTYEPGNLEEFGWTHDSGWNHYVTGTIAYLYKDRKILNVSVERYKALELKKRAKQELDQEQWPVNLRILIAFQKCFGKSYEEGYTVCRD